MAATAWPFLIARGRERGYSVLLAPQFLLADGDYGFLEEATGPLHPSQPVRVGVAVSRRGTRYHLAWSEYRVTATDIGGEPRDEHSRPLLLLYGALSTDGSVGGDLEQARRTALDTYRRFLADENGFTTEPSAPIGTSTTPDADSPPAPRPIRRMVIGTAVIVVAVAAAVVAIAATSGQDPPPPPCSQSTAKLTTTCAPTTPKLPKENR